MILYIVRHGIAEDRASGNVHCDSGRALTEKGRRRTGVVARGLVALGCSPACIGTSPLTRADETARILADALSPAPEVQVCDFLAPGADARDVAKWLCEVSIDEAVIVGHMPDVAGIASDFLCPSDDVELLFKKAAVCCLSFYGRAAVGAATLEWLLQPKHFRVLARQEAMLDAD